MLIVYIGNAIAIGKCIVSLLERKDACYRMQRYVVLLCSLKKTMPLYSFTWKGIV